MLKKFYTEGPRFDGGNCCFKLYFTSSVSNDSWLLNPFNLAMARVESRNERYAEQSRVDPMTLCHFSKSVLFFKFCRKNRWRCRKTDDDNKIQKQTFSLEQSLTTFKNEICVAIVRLICYFLYSNSDQQKVPTFWGRNFLPSFGLFCLVFFSFGLFVRWIKNAFWAWLCFSRWKEFEIIFNFHSESNWLAKPWSTLGDEGLFEICPIAKQILYI